MNWKTKIKKVVECSPEMTPRFAHFLLAIIGDDRSEIDSAVLSSDDCILFRRVDDIGYNDFTGWTVSELKRNLKGVADCAMLTEEEFPEFLHAAEKVFDSVDGKQLILI